MKISDRKPVKEIIRFHKFLFCFSREPYNNIYTDSRIRHYLADLVYSVIIKLRQIAALHFSTNHRFRTVAEYENAEQSFCF